MTRPLVAVCVCGAAAIGTGILTLPRVEERSAMFSRDGDLSNAMRVLEAASQSTPDDAKLLLRIHQLQEQVGNGGQSIQTLEAYLRKRPNDIWGWDRLATLYASTMEPSNERRALERLIDLNPRSARVSDLLGLYFKVNDDQAEYRLLSNREVWPQLRAHEFRRLGSLALKHDDLNTALDALRHYDQLASLKDEESRFLFLDLLVRLQLLEEAGGRLVQWSSAWSQAQILDAVRILSAVEDADRLATVVLKIGERKAGVDLQIASDLAASGELRASRAILAAWSNVLRPRDHHEINLFVSACRRGNDLATAVTWYRVLNADRSKAAEAVFVADRIYWEFGPNALDSERQSLLQAERLALRPFFGANWALGIGSQELAIRALWLGSPEHVEVEDAGKYAQLLFDTLGPEAVFDKLKQIKLRGRTLTPEVALALDEKARSLGLGEMFNREAKVSSR